MPHIAIYIITAQGVVVERFTTTFPYIDVIMFARKVALCYQDSKIVVRKL